METYKDSFKGNLDMLTLQNNVVLSQPATFTERSRNEHFYGSRRSLKHREIYMFGVSEQRLVRFQHDLENIQQGFIAGADESLFK